MKKTLRLFVCIAMIAVMAIGLAVPGLAITVGAVYSNDGIFGRYAWLQPNTGTAVTMSELYYGVGYSTAILYGPCNISHSTTDYRIVGAIIYPTSLNPTGILSIWG